MTTKMQELKALLKTKATKIRECKRETKEYQRKHGGSCGGRQWRLIAMKSSYRSHHIAYSMLRGRTIDQIEPVTNSDNEPDWGIINAIKEEYAQDVCTNAA